MRLGEILIQANVIHPGQLQMALDEQRRWGGLLGEILVRLGALTEEALVEAVSRQLGVAPAEPHLLAAPERSALQGISREAARSLRAVPLALQDGGRTLVVAMAEPQNVSHLDGLRRATGRRPAPRLVGPTALQALLDHAYPESEEGFKVLDSQGRTVMKLQEASPPAPIPQPAARTSDDLHGLARRLEEVQRREAAALHAMVDLLIERGLFSREEYLAKLRR